MSDQQEVSWDEVGKEEAAAAQNLVRLREVGQSVIGKYLGTIEVKGGQFGDETHYRFSGEGADGQPSEFTINPQADLRRRYSVLKVGQIVRTTRMEDKPATVAGQNAAFTFKVEIAKLPGSASVPAPAAPKKDPALDFLG